METHIHKNYAQIHGSYHRTDGCYCEDDILQSMIINEVQLISRDGRFIVEVFDKDDSGEFVSVQKIEYIPAPQDARITPWMWHGLVPGQKIRIIEITKSEE